MNAEKKEKDAEKNVPSDGAAVVKFKRFNKGGSGEMIGMDWLIPLDQIPDSGFLYTAPAVADATVPDGEFVLMPRRLTAENGAKAALSGEFSERFSTDCPVCNPDETDTECEICSGSGRFIAPVPVEWDTIKCIYKAAVELLAAAPTPPTAQAVPREGQEISVDVSTGDHDTLHRVFARLTGELGSDGKTWLAEMTEDNQPAAQAGQEASALVRDLVKLWDSQNVSEDDYNDEMNRIEAAARAFAATQPAAIRSAGLHGTDVVTALKEAEELTRRIEAFYDGADMFGWARVRDYILNAISTPTAPEVRREALEVARYRFIRSLASMDFEQLRKVQEAMDIFPDDDDRIPTPEEFDASVDAGMAALQSAPAPKLDGGAA